MASIAMRSMGNNIQSNLSKQLQFGGGRNSHIDWHDYNFPPLIKLIHFKLSDFEGAEKSVIKKMYISWILLIVVLILNILSTIVLSATVLKGINVLYSFLNLFLFSVAGTFVFFWGYYGIAKRESGPILRYKIGAGILAILYLMFSIWNLGAFNGWVRISELSDYDEGAAGFGIFMSIAESTLYTVNALLSGYCLYLVHREAFEES